MSEKRLVSVSVVSASVHATLFSFILAYPSIALIRFVQQFDPERDELAIPDPWWLIWLVLPVAMALLGGCWTILVCLAYNITARLLGGVRYTSQGESPP